MSRKLMDIKYIKRGDILIFNSSNLHPLFKIGDRVIFKGLLIGEMKPLGLVDFGSVKNMICDISLFTTLREIRENRINEALELSK
jgi:hypothetical protein